MTRMKPRPRRSSHSTAPPFALMALGLSGAVAAALVYGLGLPVMWALLLALNVATFAAYAYDKSAAGRAGASRVPERVLHGLAALGGTPSAWAAQRLLRHKILKGSFRARFWLIAAGQVVFLAALVWWIYHGPGH